MSTKDQQVQGAFATGLSGSSGPAIAGTLTLVKLALESWAGGPWTINIARMVSSIGAGATVPQRDMVVRFKWGTGNAMDEATIDYPISGAVAVVSGASVEVYAETRSGSGIGPAVVNNPIVGAHAVYGAGVPSLLTFTDLVQEVALVGVPAEYLRPAHAVAYRLVNATFDFRACPGVWWQVRQINGAGAPVSIDHNTSNAPIWGQLFPAAANLPMGGGRDMEAWVPLHPAATRVDVQELIGAAGAAVAVQWKIEL